MKKPLIAASLFGSASRCVSLAVHFKKSGVDMVEIRFDLCSDKLTPEFCHALAKDLYHHASIRKIATFRIREEGGNPHLFHKKSRRENFYEAVLPYMDYVDVELAAEDKKNVISLAKKARRKVIVSVHELNKMSPDNKLERVLKKGFSEGADMMKLACFAESAQDALRLLAFTKKNSDKPLITVALGEQGVFTRVLAGLFGSRILFGHAGKASFPRQLSVKHIADGLKLFGCR